MDTLSDHVLHSAAGRFNSKTQSKPTDVPRILDLAQARNPAKGLLLHFHGGLINKTSGLKIAADLAKEYVEADTYPIFFVWESGVADALLNNKGDVLRDPAFRELVKKVSEWVLKRIGGAAIYKGASGSKVDVGKLRSEYDAWFDGQRPAPPSPDTPITADKIATKGSDTEDIEELAQDIESGFDNDPDFVKAMEEAYNAQLPPNALATKGSGSQTRAQHLLLSEQAQKEMFGTASGEANTKGFFTLLMVARFVAKIVFAVVKRYRKQREHGFYCTVVEEVLRSAYAHLIGGTIWNQMKKDTLDSFTAGDDFCGTQVVSHLRKLEDSGRGFSQITLVGHSTGAIYICHLLDAIAKAQLKTPIKVVFLAPALTHTLFATAVRNHGSTLLKQFRLFGMSDALEREDRMLGLLYTRSLLYFVSGLLEGTVVKNKWKYEYDMPIGGMQRYLTEPVFKESFADIDTVAQFLSADPTRTVWSEVQGGPGLNSKATKHGDFDNDRDTLDSVKAFI